MIPAAQIQTWASSLAPVRLSALAVAAVVVLALSVGVWRGRGQLRAGVATLLFLALGATALDLAGRDTAVRWQIRALWGAAVLAWSAIVVSSWRRRGARAAAPADIDGAPAIDLDAAFAPSAEDPFRGDATFAVVAPSPAVRPARLARVARLLLTAVFALAAVLLLDHLGDYAGTLVHWESPVVADGFAEAAAAGTPLLEYARQRAVWDNGILSRGDTSLFFGVPAYALLQTFGYHTWTLRLMSVLATLLSMGALYALGRRFFSPSVGAAAALFYGLGTPVLFYGRYGSSIAGTLLAVLLALYAVWAFLSRPRSAWWLGPLCALALYTATLQYAPARLFVLFILAYLPLALVLDRSARRWQSLVGLALIAAGVVAVYRFELAHGAAEWFLHARGEQFFELVKNPGSIQPLTGIDVGTLHGEDVDWRAEVRILGKLLSLTVPQFLNLVSPRADVRGGGRVVLFDPPDMPLYFAPVGLLIALGIAYSLPRWRSSRHLFLLTFPVVYAVPLLLTNRVDAHRAILLVIPFALWAALGAREVARLLTRLGVPRLLQLAAALPFVAAIVCEDVRVRYPLAFPEPTTAIALAERVAAIPGSVTLGLVFDHRERNWLQLQLLERRRRAASDRSVILPDSTTVGLRADRGSPRTPALRQVEQLARRSTVILGPASYFRGVVGPLQKAGLRVAEERCAGVPLLRVDAGAAATGIASADLNVLALAEVSPTPTPPRLRRGRKVWLTDLRPVEVSFGFAEPQFGKTWNGEDVMMGGVVYKRAIGTHAWTRLTYAVPENTVAFEAIVGLSDQILGCERASVVFEVRDVADRVLAMTGVITPGTPPQLITAMVGEERRIVLSVTEAGDGRDCDHANWASPAFLLGRTAVRFPGLSLPGAAPTPPAAGE